MRSIWIFLLSFVLRGTVAAHEHWIDADSFRPSPGNTIQVFACSGHEFPESAFALSGPVFHSFCVIHPNGSEEPIQTAAEENRRTGAICIPSQGQFILVFTLKKPQMDIPLFWAKAIVLTGEGSYPPNGYRIGKGLEIVPEEDISAMGPGMTLYLSLFYNGEQIQGNLFVQREGGKSIRLTTDKDRPAVFKIKKAGKYLMTSSYEGKACSLTFSIKE